MRYWYASFRSRHQSMLSNRRSEAVSHLRLNAEQDHESIAHYFSLLSEWQHLPPQQIYAADETGLDGDGDRDQTVLAPLGAKRVL